MEAPLKCHRTVALRYRLDIVRHALDGRAPDEIPSSDLPRHVHNKVVGLILRVIALLILHGWDHVAQLECNAQSMDDLFQ